MAKVYKRESQLITRLRAIAVFLIVTAHCNAMPNNATECARVVEGFVTSFAFLGVWIFFALGGYLFAYEKRPAGEIIARKAETLILPWLFTGTLVYLWTFLRHGGLSLSGLLHFVAGYGSYLWYMSVFLVLIVLFAFLRNKTYPLILPVVYGIVLSLPAAIHLIAGEDYNLYYYLAGAWSIAFTIGFAVNRYNMAITIYKASIKHGLVFALVFGVTFALLFILRGRLYYWSIQYIPLCLLFTPTVLWLTTVLERKLGTIMDRVGGISFSIYLLHLPIAGAVSNLFGRFDRGYSVIIRPFIVLAICFAGISIMDKLLSSASKLAWARKLIGLR